MDGIKKGKEAECKVEDAEEIESERGINVKGGSMPAQKRVKFGF